MGFNSGFKGLKYTKLYFLPMVLYGKEPLGRPRRRWGDNITMDIRKVGCGGMDWIELAQDRGR